MKEFHDIETHQESNMKNESFFMSWKSLLSSWLVLYFYGIINNKQQIKQAAVDDDEIDIEMSEM